MPGPLRANKAQNGQKKEIRPKKGPKVGKKYQKYTNFSSFSVPREL